MTLGAAWLLAVLLALEAADFAPTPPYSARALSAKWIAVANSPWLHASDANSSVVAATCSDVRPWRVRSCERACLA